MDPNPTQLNHHSAMALLRSESSSEADKLKAGATLILEQHYDDYPEIIRTLETLNNQYGKHPLWNFCMGYAKATHQSADPAIAHLYNALGKIANNQLIYRALTWAHLFKKAFPEAILSSSAGLHYFPNDGHLQGLLNLANSLAQGKETTKLNFKGTDYSFYLFTNNTQEIEAALTHNNGCLTEMEELELIRSHVGEVTSIAEIGCLVGNHSAFFLKNLKPGRFTIIDASSTSLKHAKANVELNRDPTNPTRVRFIHSAVGGESGELSFFNETVSVNPLDSLLQEPFDFLKIDVDGMEMDALIGARQYLETYRPKVMIEVLHLLREPFIAFIQKVNYRIIAQHDRDQYSNYLIVPN